VMEGGDASMGEGDSWVQAVDLMEE
jgi:hypothetical protein